MEIEDLTYEKNWYSWIEQKHGVGKGWDDHDRLSVVMRLYNKGHYNLYQSGDLDIIGLGSRAVWVHPSGEAYTSGPVNLAVRYRWGGHGGRYKLLSMQQTQ